MYEVHKGKKLKVRFKSKLLGILRSAGVGSLQVDNESLSQLRLEGVAETAYLWVFATSGLGDEPLD